MMSSHGQQPPRMNSQHLHQQVPHHHRAPSAGSSGMMPSNLANNAASSSSAASQPGQAPSGSGGIGMYGSYYGRPGGGHVGGGQASGPTASALGGYGLAGMGGGRIVSGSNGNAMQMMMRDNTRDRMPDKDIALSLPCNDSNSYYSPFPPSTASLPPSTDFYSSEIYTPQHFNKALFATQPFNTTKPTNSNSIEGFTISSESQEDANVGDPAGNRGNKLKRGARWVRKGKAVAWGTSWAEREAEDRLRHRLRLTLSHHLPPNLALPARSPSPPPLYLPHLPPSPKPVTSASLSNLLQLPRNYKEFVTSVAMRHTFANSKLEAALGKTAGELIESEVGLLKALGRLHEEVRVKGEEAIEDRPEDRKARLPNRHDDEEDEMEEVEGDGVAQDSAAPASTGLGLGLDLNATGANGQVAKPNAPAEATVHTTNGTSGPLEDVVMADNNASTNAPIANGHAHSNGSNGTVVKDQPQDTPVVPQETGAPALVPKPEAPATVPSNASTTATDFPQRSESSNGVSVVGGHIPGLNLTPLEKMFITESNIAIPGPYPGVPQTITAAQQKEIMYRSLDALGELLADSKEYVERLSEVRERLASVGRERKYVWRVVRDRCDRELREAESKMARDAAVELD